MWQELDENCDGLISKTEWLNYWHSVLDTHDIDHCEMRLMAIREHLMSNSNALGLLKKDMSAKSASKSNLDWLQNQTVNKQVTQQIEEVFKLLDTDGDGHIDHQEIKDCMSPFMNPNEIKNFVARFADSNQRADFQVGRQEWRSHWLSFDPLECEANLFGARRCLLQAQQRKDAVLAMIARSWSELEQFVQLANGHSGLLKQLDHDSMLSVWNCVSTACDMLPEGSDQLSLKIAEISEARYASGLTKVCTGQASGVWRYKHLAISGAARWI